MEMTGRQDEGVEYHTWAKYSIALIECYDNKKILNLV